MSKKRTKISIRGLKKSFGSNSVLTGLNLDVTEGESLAVIGGSGSGKSVLVKSILGLIKPAGDKTDRDAISKCCSF